MVTNNRAMMATLIALVTPASNPVWAVACNNDLYVGYYIESPLTNPEDPVPGALFLNIPTADGPFSGDMFFTYVGCQSQNVGSISGQRQGNSLSGQWSGTVDGTSQSGSFNGARDPSGAYIGSYLVSAGKQYIEVTDCIEYFIAPNGAWALSPANETTPDDDLVQFADNQISWTQVAGAALVQCQLLDRDKASCGDPGAILWQRATPAASGPLDVPTSLLLGGTQYIASCSQFDSQLLPLAFSKSLFTYSAPAGNDVIFGSGFES